MLSVKNSTVDKEDSEITEDIVTNISEIRRKLEMLNQKRQNELERFEKVKKGVHRLQSKLYYNNDVLSEHLHPHIEEHIDNSKEKKKSVTDEIMSNFKIEQNALSGLQSLLDKKINECVSLKIENEQLKNELAKKRNVDAYEEIEQMDKLITQMKGLLANL